MFTGLVEAYSAITHVEPKTNAIEIQLSRPSHFDDLKLGDSICCNGVCLTLSFLSENKMGFVMAYETLKTLAVNPDQLLGQVWNLERSLRFGDRVHGHLVTGHVESLGIVVRNEAFGDSWLLDVQVPKESLSLIWKKGSLCLHGVSLTVNDVKNSIVSVCLIPETVNRTNLSQLPVGGHINIETDYLAKAYLNKESGRTYEI